MNRNKQFVIWIGILSFIFVLATYGQTEQNSGVNEPEQLDSWIQKIEQVTLGEAELLELGYAGVDDDDFLELQIQPNEDFGKFGAGLDLPIFFLLAKEEERILFTEDRVSLEKLKDIRRLLRLIHHLRYGHVNEPFYIHFGEFQYVTIGHGLLMSGYSNHDRRGLRLNIVCEKKLYGIETVINDLGNPTILGGRLFVRPLQTSNIRFLNLNKLEIGMTEFIDIDSNRSMVLNKNPLIALGVDASFPFIDKKSWRVYLYDDFALMNTKLGIDEENEFAIGNACGLGLRISQTAFFKIEGHIFEGGFHPTLFDNTYDPDKGDIDKDVATGFMKMEVDEDRFRLGGRGMIALRAGSKMDFFTTFEYYTTTEPKLYIGIMKSDDWFERLSFRAFYSKRNIPNIKDSEFIENLFRLDNESTLAIRARSEIGWGLDLIVLYERGFKRIEDTEAQFEPIEKLSFKVGTNRIF